MDCRQIQFCSRPSQIDLLQLQALAAFRSIGFVFGANSEPVVAAIEIGKS